MSTITTRSGKGSPLTHNEVDANFTNLNTDKYQSGDNVTFGTATVTTFTSTGIDDNATSTAITIDASENVGIGNTTPNSYSFDTGPALVIGSGSNNPHLSVLSSTTGTGYLSFADGTTGNQMFRGLIEYAHSTDHMGFRTAGTERMRLDSSGRLGIGTTSPTEKLSVIGNLLLNNASGDVGIKLGPTGVEAYIGYAGSSGNLQITPRSGYNTTISSGNVGIGTASPNSYANYTTLTLRGTTGSEVDFENSSGTVVGAIYNTATNLTIASDFNNAVADSNIVFTCDGTERMRIDSSGRVGIGASSPSNKLTVNGDQVLLANGELKFADATNNQVGTIRNSGGASTSQLEFLTANTERMRITSGGDLLVGKTAAGIGTDGVQIQSDGGGVFTTNGATSLLVNRRTSDGTIIDVRKDGATVGNIGVATSELYLSSGNTGLYFDDVNNLIRPTNSAGALRDNTVNLGKSDSRFKDLYLSGGAYLGGTGAANHLDDYEEGTWTPSLSSGSISGTSITYTGTYRKVGSLVYIYFQANSASHDVNIASYAVFSGLPFSLAYAGTGTAVTEDIDVFDRQGYAQIQSTSLQISNSGSSSGTTSIVVGVVGATS